MSIFDPSHEKLIEFINRYYTRRGWRIISIVKGNGNFWATGKKSFYPLTGGSYILYATFKRKNFLTILKNKEIVRTMIKKERERQIKKAYIFYRRRVRTLLATGRYLLTIDYRKKDINNEK
jgi:hypothetical protein